MRSKINPMDAYTIPEAADLTGLTPKEIRLLIETGDLRAFQAGRRHRIPHEELLRSGLLGPPEPVAPQAEALPPDRVELEALRARVDEIERRLEAVEAPDDHSRRPADMRAALEPLFAPPRGRFERPT